MSTLCRRHQHQLHENLHPVQKFLMAYGLTIKNNDQRSVVPTFTSQMQLELVPIGANTQIRKMNSSLHNHRLATKRIPNQMDQRFLLAISINTTNPKPFQ